MWNRHACGLVAGTVLMGSVASAPPPAVRLARMDWAYAMTAPFDVVRHRRTHTLSDAGRL